MQLETQKNIAFYASYFFSFCIGLENGIIIPTILEYLHILGVQHEAILGIAVAGFWLASSVSSRVLTRLVESSHNVKLLLITCSAFFVTGGFLYGYGDSWWSVAIARLCCGVGSGAFAVIDADVTGSSLGEELTQLQWHLRLSAGLGWTLSPLFSLAISAISLEPPSMPNNAIPGLLCASLFIVCGILTLIGFCDLGKKLRFCRLGQSLSLAYERFSISSRKSYGAVSHAAPEFDNMSLESDRGGCARIYGLWSVSTSATSSVASSKRQSPEDKNIIKCCSRQITSSNMPLGLSKGEYSWLTKSDEVLETAECFMGLPHTPARVVPQTPKTPSASTPSEQRLSDEDYPVPRFRVFNKKGFCYNLEKTHWLGPYFLSAFLFGSIQTMLTPLTARYFSFGGAENAVTQLVLGAIGLAPRLLTRLCEVPRKALLVSGYLLATISVGSLLMLCPADSEESQVNVPSFGAGMLGLSLACGLLFSACHEEGQRPGARPLWARVVGLVLGPLWSGSTVGQPRLLLGCQLGLVVIAAFTNII